MQGRNRLVLCDNYTRITLLYSITLCVSCHMPCYRYHIPKPLSFVARDLTLATTSVHNLQGDTTLLAVLTIMTGIIIGVMVGGYVRHLIKIPLGEYKSILFWKRVLIDILSFFLFA